MAIIEAIETVYLEADAASVTFSSLSGYEHLEIRGTGQSNSAGATDNVKVQFNSDTGNNYNYHYMGGEGSTEWVGKTINVGYILFPYNVNGATIASSGSNDMYDTFRCIIHDYANGSKNTTLSGLAQGKGNAASHSSSAYISRHVAFWDNVAAVTSIKIFTNSGDWLRGTEISIYGIKSS